MQSAKLQFCWNWCSTWMLILQNNLAIYPEPIFLKPERFNKGIMESGIITFAIITHWIFRFRKSSRLWESNILPIPSPRKFFNTKNADKTTAFVDEDVQAWNVMQPAKSSEKVLLTRPKSESCDKNCLSHKNLMAAETSSRFSSIQTSFSFVRYLW